MSDSVHLPTMATMFYATLNQELRQRTLVTVVPARTWLYFVPWDYWRWVSRIRTVTITKA